MKIGAKQKVPLNEDLALLGVEQIAENVEPDFKALAKQVLFHYDKAEDAATSWVKEYFKFMLSVNVGRIDKIINAMGVTAFYNKGRSLSEEEEQELQGYDELNEFLEEWDDIFGLQGLGITVTKNGIKRD